jgi:hypothetical protein
MAELDRRRVTMTNAVATANGVEIHQAEDFVDVANIDVYVADAKTRWQSVTVGDAPDHGPGGVDGSYDVTAAVNPPQEA